MTKELSTSRLVAAIAGVLLLIVTVVGVRLYIQKALPTIPSPAYATKTDNPTIPLPPYATETENPTATSPANFTETNNITWQRYSSSLAKISFDYPANWSIHDDEETAFSSDNDGQRYLYNDLWICPAASQSESGPKELLNNCIIFYTATRILHPIAGFSDESTIFEDFSQFLQGSSAEYESFRIMELRSDGDNNLHSLTGLYRDAGGVAGVFQGACNENAATECILVFKHVLDSLAFVK